MEIFRMVENLLPCGIADNQGFQEVRRFGRCLGDIISQDTQRYGALPAAAKGICFFPGTLDYIAERRPQEGWGKNIGQSVHYIEGSSALNILIKY